ncbi:MAG: hypothetical protein CVT49_01680 [candidate division Zixibacteria bacterium HGW-Zixibacteria-1]|nr:MAG: hypothetical protein CVT49_01680 [candidate division Zixibacteria bacterium HGW-Zixibacteria-1]
MKKDKFKFDFAISYAGEDVGLVRDICKLLLDNGAKIYFDRSNKPFLVGKKLSSETTQIYGPLSCFCVPIISKHYVNKYWTKREYVSALKEEETRKSEFILPILLDDVNFDQLAIDKIYIDLRKEGIFDTVDILIAKLSQLPSSKPITGITTWVATFGIHVNDFAASYDRPPNAPYKYYELCDWLENDLIKRLEKSRIKRFALTEASERNGETLSIRVAFRWDPSKEVLDFGDVAWWDVLEIIEYEKVYSNSSNPFNSQD